MRYRYHNLLYEAHGAPHGLYFDPVRRDDGRCIVSRDKALVRFEDGTEATVIRRCLRLKIEINRAPRGRNEREMAIKKQKTKPVMITTAKRGIFFGYLAGPPPKPGESATITNARNCLSWSADVQGFLGLAASGPSDTCRIGPAVPEMTLYEITSVVQTTPEAAAQWEAAPWSP